MISKPNAVVSKGMVFAGCSFTWGQGLYYYSNMPSLKEPPPDHYRSQLVRWTHHKFQETIRYPRLVANHFNTFELTQDFNGGATHSIIAYWNERFNANAGDFQKSIEDRNQNYDYDDISHVFFQFTQWSRTELTIEHNGKTVGPKQRYEIWQNPEHLGTFIEWLNAQNITFDEFLHRSKHEDVARVKAFLENFEQHGIKTAVLTWPEDMVEYIKADPWMVERFMQLEHNGSTWSSIEKLMTVHRELTINSDLEYFEEPPKDHHPSMGCHRIMADSIIKHLEKSKNI
jgi:hypothetical protein